MLIKSYLPVIAIVLYSIMAVSQFKGYTKRDASLMTERLVRALMGAANQEGEAKCARAGNRPGAGRRQWRWATGLKDMLKSL